MLFIVMLLMEFALWSGLARSGMIMKASFSTGIFATKANYVSETHGITTYNAENTFWMLKSVTYLIQLSRNKCSYSNEWWTNSQAKISIMELTSNEFTTEYIYGILLLFL